MSHPRNSGLISPPPTTPWRFIAWVLRPGVGRMTVAVIALDVAALVHMALPWFLSRIVDEGLTAGDRGALLSWSLGMFAVALVNPLSYVIGHRQMALSEAAARRRVAECLTDRLNIRTGRVGETPIASGEIVNLVTGDNESVASTYFTVGHGAMNVTAFVLGTVQVWRIHPWLGVTVGLGVVATAFVAGPLLGRLQQRQSDYRDTLADLTRQAADVVAGLRVLRGIGGERLFLNRYRSQSEQLRDSAYRVTDSSSWVQALQQTVPLAYLAAVTWLGARLTLSGSISVGELSAAFGYATGLVMYSGSLLNNAHAVVASYVAASRLAKVFAAEEGIGDEGHAPAPDGALHDPRTRLTIPPGELTVIVADKTASAASALRRLAGYSDSDATWGGRPLAEIEVQQVRTRILLLADDDYLFAGTLRDALNADEDTALAALDAACATDVRTSLGSSLDGEMDDRARNLSGGQRQRLMLARALAAHPDILLAVEPTSAVDAVTEARITERVKAAREGRTTAVVTSSPLWIARADHIVRMADVEDGSESTGRPETEPPTRLVTAS